MVLGLTGGIGSGKSVVARIFETMGCAVFNSDRVARQIYFAGDIRPKVTALLGSGTYLPEMRLDKSYISSRIFADADLLASLNQIIHPAVSLRFADFIYLNRNKIIIKESALLFEANATGGLEKIITVTADEGLRIERSMARDNGTQEDVLKKIKNQMPQSEKIKKSDFVIDNNGAVFLTPQVLTILEKISYA